MTTPEQFDPQMFAKIAQQAQMERERQAAEQAQQEQSALQLTQMLEEKYGPLRQAALGKVQGQFDPIIEQLIAQSQSMAPKQETPNKWGDLSSIIGNAFYTARFGKEVPTPMERRKAEAARDAQQQQNVLAQLRLMMEGKSKAEDRITDNFGTQMGNELKTMTAAENAKMAREKWLATKEQADKRLEYQGMSVNNSIRRTDASVASLQRTAEAQAEQLMAEKYPNLPKNSPEYVTNMSALVADIKAGRTPSKGSVKVASDVNNNPVLMPVPGIKPQGPGLLNNLPKTAPVDTTNRGGLKPTPIPNAQMGRTPSPAAPPPPVRTTEEIPNKSAKSWWTNNGIVNAVPVVRKNEKRIFVGPGAAETVKFVKGLEQKSAVMARGLDSLNQMVEKKQLAYLAPNDFANIIDLAASVAFEPGTGAAMTDKLRNAIASTFSNQEGGMLARPIETQRTFLTLAENLATAIKEQTGAAGSFQEYSRISYKEPQRGDPPEMLAEKMIHNLMVNQVKLMQKDMYVSDKGSLSGVDEEVLASYLNRMGQAVGKALYEGRLSSATLGQFMKPETIIQGAILYDQAVRNGKGDERLEGLVRGVQNMKPAIMRRMQEQNAKPSGSWDSIFGGSK